MNELKCPHCGSTEVYDSDCFDMEITFDDNTGNDVVLRKINGCCDNCGATDLLWTEVYELKGYKDIMTNN